MNNIYLVLANGANGPTCLGAIKPTSPEDLKPKVDRVLAKYAIAPAEEGVSFWIEETDLNEFE